MAHEKKTLTNNAPRVHERRALGPSEPRECYDPGGKVDYEATTRDSSRGGVVSTCSVSRKSDTAASPRRREFAHEKQVGRRDAASGAGEETST